MSKTKNTFNTLNIIYVALFSAIITVCSWVSVPAAVPFTLQTMAVFIAVGLLGGKLGTISVCVYILLGTVGVPVFSGFKGGIGAIFGVTGGYIVGFIFAALVMWAAEKLFGNGGFVLAFSMVAGLAVCYAFGTAWFIAVYAQKSGTISLFSVLSMCVFPYIVPDALKIAAAIIVVRKVQPAIKTANLP